MSNNWVAVQISAVTQIEIISIRVEKKLRTVVSEIGTDIKDE